MSNIELIIVILVFGSAAGLAMTIASVLSGDAAERLRTRLLALRDVEALEQSGSAIRGRYLRQLSPLERWLEQLPGMDALRRLTEQAGKTTPAYRTALAVIGMMLLGGVIAAAITGSATLVVVAMAAMGAVPVIQLFAGRRKRLAEFETQLPDALDLMSRALRAGNPLLESFKFISEEMRPPIAVDFGRAWSHVNYGVSLKAALIDLVDHAPSVSLRALVTAILVQRETGGNLAELLDRLSGVLRGRARFQRRLRTLTAEGRISAWVLILMPFAVAAMLSVTSPDYLPVLVREPLGHKMIGVAAVLMVLGIFWISRIVRIRV